MKTRGLLARPQNFHSAEANTRKRRGRGSRNFRTSPQRVFKHPLSRRVGKGEKGESPKGVKAPGKRLVNH